EITTVDQGLELLEQLDSQIGISSDCAGFDKCLPLPGTTFDVVIGKSTIAADADRPACPLGTKPHIDPVGDSHGGRFGEESDEIARQTLEELLVRCGATTIGLAFPLVDEDQVDVARVVEFLSSEFAQRQDHEVSRPS